MNRMEQNIQSNQAVIRNLEVQISQVAREVSERGKGKLPSNTQVNPKQDCMAFVLRSALAEMPAYTKFLKEIISNKKKLDNFSTVALTEECSSILQNKLPPKLKDSGSFTIPCHFGDSNIFQCLCDLGASINLIPLSLYNRLGICELKLTTISLQLADRSIRYPIGIVEDLLVKVGKLIIPADFVVLEIEFDM
ncbi:hypothetical protein K2173_004916 [Erythroxylum novogranatense]|uniref:Reverse transcriptase domain-containing protein n=1 Tax=Erythroxylum novogranatense TaxID=1862640 RepID=A0AAV8TB33_9ROSI|nr:hypothetical protein K2173_004916 [Erythroxylum novogranatense]